MAGERLQSKCDQTAKGSGKSMVLVLWYASGICVELLEPWSVGSLIRDLIFVCTKPWSWYKNVFPGMLVLRSRIFVAYVKMY